MNMLSDSLSLKKGLSHLKLLDPETSIDPKIRFLCLISEIMAVVKNACENSHFCWHDATCQIARRAARIVARSVQIEPKIPSQSEFPSIHNPDRPLLQPFELQALGSLFEVYSCQPRGG